MSHEFTNETKCREAQALLSDYQENTLSARQVWAVEKHLAVCAECAALSHQMQATVLLLHRAESYDTGDDFMAKLHARLDGLEPEPLRRSPLTAMRDWLADIQQRVQSKPLSALSLGMASLALAVIFIAGRPTEVPIPTPISSASGVSREALDRHVAVTASNPFDDPVAAKLEADTENDNAVRPD